MKNLLPLALAVFTLFGLSSCCCMISGLSKPEYRETQKKVGYDTIVEEVPVGGSKSAFAKGGMSKGGMTQTVERKVPRYKDVKEKVWCNNCWRFYCPDRACCGTTGKKTRTMASAQGHSGSPNIGLIPTMKPLVPCRSLTCSPAGMMIAEMSRDNEKGSLV